MKRTLWSPFCLGKYNMTTTKYFRPTSFSNVSILNTTTNQYSIDWNYNGAISENNYAVTHQPLYTISGIWMERFLSNTSQLWCTNLKIPNNNQTIHGIEFNLVMERYARIEDLLIQLTLGGELIGNNYASTINPVPADIYTGDDYGVILTPPGNNFTYGGSNDLWGTTSLTSANLADPTFGVVVSFKSNLAFPHRDLAYLYQLGVRITYA